jgi:hypothetical protein
MRESNVGQLARAINEDPGGLNPLCQIGGAFWTAHSQTSVLSLASLTLVVERDQRHIVPLPLALQLLRPT